jgi:hypothetical protein
MQATPKSKETLPMFSLALRTGHELLPTFCFAIAHDPVYMDDLQDTSSQCA